MLSLFHNIAAIFLLFTVVNWVLDRMLYSVLISRWLRTRSRRIRRSPADALEVAGEVVSEVVVLVFTLVGQIAVLALGIASGGGIYMATNVKDVITEVLVYIATNVKAAMEMIIYVMAPDNEEEDARQRCRTTLADVERNERHTPAVVKTERRAGGRAERLRVETSLEDDPNRNWSNEHGNLSSPESSPVARSVRHTPSIRVCRPSPNRVHPVAASGSSDTSAPSERLTYEEYMEWCSVRGIRRGSFGAGGLESASTSVSGSLSGGINTPSASSSSLNPFNTPAASSSSSGGIRTPSASSSSSGGIRTPTSTRSPTSGSTSCRGALTPTSSSGSQSTVIHTPTSTRTTNSGDSSRPGTPDSTSSSGSDSTVIRTPSP
jgi:hypothetical protein